MTVREAMEGLRPAAGAQVGGQAQAGAAGRAGGASAPAAGRHAPQRLGASTPAPPSPDWRPSCASATSWRTPSSRCAIASRPSSTPCPSGRTGPSSSCAISTARPVEEVAWRAGYERRYTYKLLHRRRAQARGTRHKMTLANACSPMIRYTRKRTQERDKALKTISGGLEGL